MGKNKLKLVYIKQFCRGCKNQRMFKVTKKHFINFYCLKCVLCGTKITYPSRWIHTNELYFKEKKKFFTSERKTLIGAWAVCLFMCSMDILGGRMG